MAYVLTWFASVFILYVYVYYYIFWKQFLLFDRLLRFSFQTLLLYWFPCWISLKNFVRSEISSNSPRTFEAPIVLVRRNYERYFAVDACELRTQEGKFALLESLVRNLERKFALLITAKCSPCIVVMHCRKNSKSIPSNSVTILSHLPVETSMNVWLLKWSEQPGVRVSVQTTSQTPQARGTWTERYFLWLTFLYNNTWNS